MHLPCQTHLEAAKLVFIEQFAEYRLLSRKQIRPFY